MDPVSVEKIRSVESLAMDQCHVAAMQQDLPGATDGNARGEGSHALDIRSMALHQPNESTGYYLRLVVSHQAESMSARPPQQTSSHTSRRSKVAVPSAWYSLAAMQLPASGASSASLAGRTTFSSHPLPLLRCLALHLVVPVAHHPLPVLSSPPTPSTSPPTAHVPVRSQPNPAWRGHHAQSPRSSGNTDCRSHKGRVGSARGV